MTCGKRICWQINGSRLLVDVRKDCEFSTEDHFAVDLAESMANAIDSYARLVGVPESQIDRPE